MVDADSKKASKASASPAPPTAIRTTRLAAARWGRCGVLDRRSIPPRSPPSGTKRPYTPKVLTEITSGKETTPAHADGWSHLYAVRRDDGEEVAVEVRCTATAEATARATDNAYAIAVIENRGAGLALQLAERVQSPAQRGRVLIKVWFDPLDRGSVRHDIDYERPIV